MREYGARMGEGPVRDDLWLVRHHMTLVVQWAVQTLGRAILVGLGVSVVFAFVAAEAGGVGGQVFGWSSLGWVLGFGCTLWWSSAPFPIQLPDEVDD